MSFVFDVEDPPVSYLVHDPDAEAYADAQGFDPGRGLDDSWSALGYISDVEQQSSMWVATEDLPRSAAHPFYTRLNQILDQHDFDRYVEELLAECGEG